MNKNILITIKKELRGFIRDKKSLLMMIITPLFIPLFVFLFSSYYDSLESDKESTYYVGINYILSDVEKDIMNDLNIQTVYSNSIDDFKKKYENDEIDAFVMLSNNNYIIYSNNNDFDSSATGTVITAYLDEYNMYLGQNYLSSINVDADNVYNNISYSYENLKGQSFSVNYIIMLSFIFAIMAISLSAIYCATDSVAGEKERGTLETILTFPIKSEELIIGKYIAIGIACSITAIISTILTIVSLSISSNIFEMYNDIVLNLNISTVSLTLLIMFIYSFFVSGVCIAISSFAKSYKEAQSMLTPVSLFTMVPMFFDIFEIELTPIISLIPIVNHVLLIESIFYGNLNIYNLIMTIISSFVYIFILIQFIVWQYKSEKIIFS